MLVAAIVVLSLIPGDRPPSINLHHYDKIAHALSYAALMAWFAIGALETLWRKIGFFVFLLGCVMECCQALIPYRTASLGDIAANSLGIVIGVFVAIILTTGSRSLRRAK